MFKKISVAVITVCLAICCISAVSPIIPLSSGIPTVKKEMLPVAKSAVLSDETVKYGARFLNMLNHNYVYGEDFDDIGVIVNNSAAALIDRMDDDGFINVSYFAEYLKNMYNITVDNLDEINADFGYKKDFVYVIPCGYTKYRHELCSVTENEDGSFTVLTTVVIDRHDDEAEQLTAVTVFVKNDESMFGYNIVSSEFAEGLLDA